MSFTLEGDLAFFKTFDGANIQVEGAELLRDPTFENAVKLSFFSERRAAVDDTIPDDKYDRSGWWGDSLIGFDIGSRAWLFGRGSGAGSLGSAPN